MATRLGQLSPAARELAGLAATIGRAFTFPVLQAAGNGDEDDLVRGLDELWQRRIVRERGADAYDFSHDKLREAAYAALSPARRRLLHRQVAQALETAPMPLTRMPSPGGWQSTMSGPACWRRRFPATCGPVRPPTGSMPATKPRPASGAGWRYWKGRLGPHPRKRGARRWQPGSMRAWETPSG